MEPRGESYQVSLKITDCEEVFTHIDHDNTVRTFLTGKMYEFAEAHAHECSGIMCVNLPIDMIPIDYLRKNAGVEPERIERLREPYLSRPIIAIWWQDNFINSPNVEDRERYAGKKVFTIIDGNHRAIKMAEMGAENIKAFIFEEYMWTQFLWDLNEDPERLVTKHSNYQRRDAINLKKEGQHDEGENKEADEADEAETRDHHQAEGRKESRA